MNLEELVKDRPTRQPPSVPSLAATVAATTRNATTGAGSKSSDTTTATAASNPLYRRASLPSRAVEVASQPNTSAGWQKSFEASFKHCWEGGSVLLCGDRWTGKTVMATRIALAFLSAGKGAVYTRGIGLLKDLRLDFNSNDLASRDLVKPYQRWHMLVIDEIGLRVRGEAGYSESDSALITDLIDQRYANRLGTIFISNEGQKASFEKLGPSITRRIEETGIVIVADWPSFSN